MYRFHHSGSGVIRLSDNAFIPSGDTAAWRDYMTWMYAGGVADPAVPPPIPPRRLSKMDLVSRLTNEEAEDIEEARLTWPAKERLTWEAAGDSVNPEDTRLVGFLDAVIGEARRQEVLS